MTSPGSVLPGFEYPLQVVLEGPDAEDYVRVAPLHWKSDSGAGVGLDLQEADFLHGGQHGWVRLDRVSWQPVAGRVSSLRLTDAALGRLLRSVCVRDARNYAQIAHAPPAFVAGTSAVPPAGKVIGAPEVQLMVEASLDGWLTAGRFNEQFERRLGGFLGRRFVSTTNSGSSANLLALTALTSPLLGERALVEGDEVLAVAAGFPTTVNPIIQNGLVPVFVDVQLPTYNIDVDRLEAAISPRTKAVMLAHTLGNPFDLSRVMALAEKHGLWVIEDCCDALGSTYNGRLVGTFGHIGTLSFYPAHHITMGEGGAVFTDDHRLARAIESIRDWGRDCYCGPGKDNTCRKRFQWKLGDLPAGYDHKYTYSHMGYNLKITDMQAAVGVAQLDRLGGFIAARRSNFHYLMDGLEQLGDVFVLPAATPGSDPSWFGFPLTIRPGLGASREDLLRFLEKHKVGTRLLFAGNIIRQPYFSGRRYRVSGSLENTETVMAHTFWIGLYPGLGKEMLDYSISRLVEFARSRL